MTDWTGSAKFWRSNAASCECPDFIASVKDPSTCGRPSVFRDVSARGLYQLLASP